MRLPRGRIIDEIMFKYMYTIIMFTTFHNGYYVLQPTGKIVMFYVKDMKVHSFLKIN